MSEENNNEPKTPLEAAIDKATGFKPGDEAKGGKNADDRDWVKEAYECFIKNAADLEPTDPAGAVWEHFKKHATDELKAKVESEGKTGASCWKFIEKVARKALGGRSGHIDPVAIYAIAMHYFQDVPKDWDKVENVKAKAKSKAKSAKDSGQTEKNGYRSNDAKDVAAARRARKVAHEKRVKLAKELGDEKFSAKVAAEGVELDKTDTKKSKAKAKAKKRGGEQGFFFDLMETEMVGPDERNGGVAAAEQDGKEAGDAE